MTLLALKIDRARARRQATPEPARARLRLVHDAKVASAIKVDPQPAFIARTATAGNKAFAFCLVVVACVGIGIGAYVSGWNDRIMTEARATVVALMAEGLPEPIAPRARDRVTGQSVE